MFEPKWPFFFCLSVLTVCKLSRPSWNLSLTFQSTYNAYPSLTFQSTYKACPPLSDQFIKLVSTANSPIHSHSPIPLIYSKLLPPRQDTPTLGYALKSAKEKQTDVGPTSILLWFCSIPKYGNNHNRIAI